LHLGGAGRKDAVVKVDEDIGQNHEGKDHGRRFHSFKTVVYLLLHYYSNGDPIKQTSINNAINNIKSNPNHVTIEPTIVGFFVDANKVKQLHGKNKMNLDEIMHKGERRTEWE
jgi:hypothetical protein